jgi:Flp pilus assembly pilin Flp
MTRTKTETDCSTSLRRRLALTAQRFVADSSGASAVEYAVLALVAIAIAAVVFQIGGSVNTMFEKVEGLFTN